MKKKYGIIFCFLFLFMSYLFSKFVIDDAYITYRYAQNLALSHELTWNLGENPVEGYTSFLWVIINALGITLGCDPTIFSKTVSLISALAIIFILIRAGVTTHWALVSIFTFAIALNPPFALLTMQGMETSFSAFLLLLTAGLSLKIMSHPSILNFSCWYLITLLSFLSRPDFVMFAFGVFSGFLLIFSLKRDLKSVKYFLFMGVPFLALGLGYMIWRVKYFGYLFPNTFYIKLGSGGSLFKFEGLKYIISFYICILLPYLVLIGMLLKGNILKDRIYKILPILLGCVLFHLYLFTIMPRQGFMWRFIMPTLPPFLLAAIYYFSGINLPEYLTRGKWTLSLVIGFFIAWNLYTLPVAISITYKKNQLDRVVTAKALAGINGTMLTTESGALPFYSGWRAADVQGLNSEEIAHQGLSMQKLINLNPDLIILLRFNHSKKKYPIVRSYMIENNFVAVAAIHKFGDRYNYYFVRTDSEIFDDIVDRLLNLNCVKYGNLQELLEPKDFQLFMGNHDLH